jgi:hypothetical protein
VKEGILGDIVCIISTHLAPGESQHQPTEAFDQHGEGGFVAAGGTPHQVDIFQLRKGLRRIRWRLLGSMIAGSWTHAESPGHGGQSRG